MRAIEQIRNIFNFRGYDDEAGREEAFKTLFENGQEYIYLVIKHFEQIPPSSLEALKQARERGVLVKIITCEDQELEGLANFAVTGNNMTLVDNSGKGWIHFSGPAFPFSQELNERFASLR